MKQKIKLLLLAVILQVYAIAQPSITAVTCDIATNGLAILNAGGTSVSTIAVGGTANLKFKVFNAGPDPNCIIPANSVEVRISLPNGAVQPYIYNGPPTFSTGIFTWTYVPGFTTNVLVGENMAPILNDGSLLSGDSVFVPIIGNTAGAASSSINMSQYLGISDNPGNNFSSALLNVVSPQALPLSLTEITVTGNKCDALLKWTTGFEKDVKHFEVQYSNTGAAFLTIGTIKATNTSNAASYNFKYSQGSTKGYYRLKMVDLNGTATYSTILTVTTSCGSAKAIKVFPNPVQATGVLSVNITGYSSQLRGELVNGMGQTVKSVVLRNGTNLLELTSLAQGFYTLRVSENGAFSEAFKITIMK